MVDEELCGDLEPSVDGEPDVVLQEACTVPCPGRRRRREEERGREGWRGREEERGGERREERGQEGRRKEKRGAAAFCAPGSVR